MKQKIDFRNVLALLVIFGSFSFVFMLFFVTVPPENKTALDMVTGAVIIAGTGAVMSFYFGDSKSSQTPSTSGTQNLITGDAKITNATPAPNTSVDETTK